VGGEIVNGELENLGHLVQLDLAAGERGRVKGRFVIVAEQVLIAGAVACRRERGGKQTLRKDHTRAKPGTVEFVGAFADARESIAGRDYPGVGSWALQVFAEVLEDGRIVGGDGGEVVEGFVDARHDAGRGHVMAEDALVDDVGQERGLGHEFIEEVRDILLAIRHESFVVARAATEGDYHGLAILRDRHAAQGGGAEEGCG